MFDDHQKSGMDLKDARIRRTGRTVEPKEREATASGVHPLDRPRMVDHHARLLSYYEQEIDRQSPNRIEQAIDHDYHDNDQWSEEDKVVLEKRGQQATVYNVIASTINWVTGSEKRGRTDFRILPRRKDASKAAERKTQLLKYLSDSNRTTFAVSRAFEDAVKGGIGWIECGTQDDDDGEPIYERYQSWRDVLWDSSSTEMDLSDARYLIRAKWVDTDIAYALAPDRKTVIDEAVVEGVEFSTEEEFGDEVMDSQEQSLDSIGNTRALGSHVRGRVRLIEIWYTMPVKTKVLSRGEFKGDIYEEGHRAHENALATGQSVLVERVKMRMHVAVMTTKALLAQMPSPYRHNKFPLTPIWCNRRSRDSLPYGMIRGMRGMQDDINKKISKIQWLLANNKVVMEEDAVPDIDELAEEIARPDAIIVVKQGKRFDQNVDRGLDISHMNVLTMSVGMIEAQSGVTKANLGRETGNNQSGKAITALQDQGGMTTTGPFDNLRLAKQIHGEKLLSLTEQYITEEKAFRITNMRGTPEYVTINDGTPENDIAGTKADFIISEQDWRASQRQSNVEQLMELMMTLAPVNPQLALVMLDIIVEEMDIASREELVARIRKITGMSDPDADEPSPEEIAKQQEAAEQAAMLKEMAAAEIAGKQADAKLKTAQAGKAEADTQSILSAIAGKNVEAQKAALEAALAVLSAPQTVPIADAMLHESGFAGRSELEDVAEATDMLAAEAADEEMAAAAAQPPPPQGLPPQAAPVPPQAPPPAPVQ